MEYCRRSAQCRRQMMLPVRSLSPGIVFNPGVRASQPADGEIEMRVLA
jgi:hypothetical protein